MTFKRNQQGQGLSEYIIIVALIAVAAIGTVSLFGGTISNQVAGMAQEMAGQDAQTEIDQAQADADAANDTSTARGLGTYNEGNTAAHQ